MLKRKTTHTLTTSALIATIVCALSLTVARAATPRPGVFENWAEAWERYQRSVVDEEQATRAGNREQASSSRASGQEALTDAQRRQTEATAAMAERSRALAAQRAELERQRARLERIHQDFITKDAAAADDRLRDRWYTRATDRMRAADEARDRWRDASSQVESVDSQISRLAGQERELTQEISHAQTEATAAQTRIDAAAALAAANQPLGGAQQTQRRLDGARAFFTQMREQGYDAKFLLMDTTLLRGDVSALKTALDTQLNSTLLGHYVNSQIEKLGTNFCSLASACTASDPATALGVPARIQGLLQGTRENAAAQSTSRSTPRASVAVPPTPPAPVTPPNSTPAEPARP